MYITEGNVSLRDFREDDIELKIKWINDSDNHKYLHYDIPLEYNKTLEWYRKRDLSKRLDCTIEYDGVSVGLIGLLEIDTRNKKAEYYITIGEHGYKNKGIATIASNLILKVAFETFELNKVYLNVDADNLPACALYEKIGMVCEGCFCEDMWHNGAFINRKRYAILRSNFKEKYCIS
jgi:RimJ/RimL family protein N-acetyltransferase